MPPKPKIIRTKPDLTGDGDAVLKVLHHQHFENYGRTLSAPLVYEVKTTKILNEIYCKTHGDIEGEIVTFFKSVVTNFVSSDTEWTLFMGTLKW